MLEPGDAVDRIVLREAGPTLARARVVVTIDDDSGDLAGAASRDGVEVRAYHDSVAGSRAAARDGVLECTTLGPELFSDAQVVLLRMPKGLAALDEMAAAVAAYAAPDVQVFAGGRIKHLSRGMNDTLAQHFGLVRASLGAQKSRVLIASEPAPSEMTTGPRQQHHDDLGLTVCAYGGTFAGTEIDLGTRFLAGFFPALPVDSETVVDLGSGSGVLGVLAATRLRRAHVVGVDDSRAAVRSTMATAVANGVDERMTARLADRLTDLDPASVDLIVCNPPFHRGTARDSTAAYAMIDDAARVLRPGGELWVVYNSHLPYLTALRDTIGCSEMLGQNPKFTVVRAVKRARSSWAARA